MGVIMAVILLIGFPIIVHDGVDAIDNVLTRLSGSWDEGVEHSSLCSEGRPRHRIVPDPKGEVLTFEFDKPRKSYDGQMRQRVRYKIVRTSADTAVLSMENETRKTNQGTLVVWELVLIDPTTYRWRGSHLPEGTYNEVVGKRCAVKE